MYSTSEVILLSHNVLSMNGKLKMKTSLLYFCFSTGLTTILNRLFDTNYRQFLTPPSPCCLFKVYGVVYLLLGTTQSKDIIKFLFFDRFNHNFETFIWHQLPIYLSLLWSFLVSSELFWTNYFGQIVFLIFNFPTWRSNVALKESDLIPGSLRSRTTDT